MALTETYVDPSIAADSGAGTIGDPYGDLQYALDSVTQDTTNGDQFNIKAGTDEILTAELDFSTYAGSAISNDRPVIFRGYTSVSGDGGIGGISGAGSYPIIDDNALDAVSCVDMHLHNCGSNYIWRLRYDSKLINCEINNATVSGTAAALMTRGQIIGCYIHDIAGAGIKTATMFGNYLENGTKNFTWPIYCGSSEKAFFNIVNVDSGANGILMFGAGITVANNTIYSTASAGHGIQVSISANVVINNYIEGFSSYSGEGIIAGGSYNSCVIWGNRAYNNYSNFTIQGNNVYVEDNESLLASGLVDPANGDFTPKDDLVGAAIPAIYHGIDLANYLTTGAVQREEAGGGGGRRPRIRRHGV